MTDLFRKEPAVIIGIVSALLTLLAAFGVAVTDDQAEAILMFVTLVIPVVGAILTRSRVSPASPP